VPRKTKPKQEASHLYGPKQERVLTCTVCDLTVTLNLAPQDERPMHRCQVVYKAMPFNKDQAPHEVAKRKWFEEKPKAPRPPAARETRPRIVL
jgi:hypothetical protein